MDLKEIVNQKVEAVLNEKLDAIVSKNVEKCLNETFESLFWSGELKKQLEQQLKDSLQINLDRAKIDTYNERITRIVSEGIGRHISENAQRAIGERIKDFLQPIEKLNWKMSEIVGIFVHDKFPRGYSYWQPTIIVEESEWGSIYFYFDEDEGKSWYDCEYKFYMIDAKKDKMVDGYEIRGAFEEPIKESSNKGRFENLIFALYANKATIEIDDYETKFYRD